MAYKARPNSESSLSSSRIAGQGLTEKTLLEQEHTHTLPVLWADQVLSHVAGEVGQSAMMRIIALLGEKIRKHLFSSSHSPAYPQRIILGIMLHSMS